MTTAQQNAINTELWQSIGAIADSESLMKRLAKYAKKLVKIRRNFYDKLPNFIREIKQLPKLYIIQPIIR